MATCQFCGRRFTNPQAVRAHLKACAAYHERDQAARSALGSAPLGTLPKGPGAGTEFTDEDTDREGQREAARQRAQERADQQAFKEVEAYLRRAAAERRARERRELIQSVKGETVGSWPWQHPTIPADVKAEALQEIERKLSALPHVDELPRRELVQLAEGIRDRLFRPVREAQEAARQRARAEEEARHRARAEEESCRRAKVEGEATRRREEEAAARERAEAKRHLLERGVSVADQELRADPDLYPGEREDIREWVHGVLEEQLSGEESKAEVDDLVDDILDEEFGQEDEDDEDADEFVEDDDNEDEYENDE